MILFTASHKYATVFFDFYLTFQIQHRYWFYRILWSCIFRCLWIEKWSRKRFREIFRGHL